MTDKEKFRKEVEKLKSNLMYGACSSQIAMETMCKEEAYNEVLAILDSLTQEPVSEDLISVAKQYIDSHVFGNEEDKFTRSVLVDMFCSGAQWQKEHLWKPADGDDLPEIDREVIALLDNGKVVFAHRPPEYWDGKNIITGKVTRNYPKTYDKGGWNTPNVKYWLDAKLPYEENKITK